jgi:hypothetical protein
LISDPVNDGVLINSASIPAGMKWFDSSMISAGPVLLLAACPRLPRFDSQPLNGNPAPRFS